MKTNIFTSSVFVLFLFLTLKPQNSLAQNNEDKKAIKETALNYIEGWYSADTIRMAKALSKDLKKRGFRVNDKTNEVSIADASYSQMINWTGERSDKIKQNQKIELKIEIIEIGKNIANVKTIAPDFIDYIHMGRINGEWKIYNVVWEPNLDHKTKK